MVPSESFQWQELGMLMLLLIGVVPMVVQYRDYRDDWFFTAYLCLIGMAVATNLEAFLLPVVFNYLEHGLMLAASFAYWMTAYKSASAVVDKGMKEAVSDMPLLSRGGDAS